MKAQVGNLDVVASGTYLVPQDEELELDLEAPGEEMYICFKFISDSTKKSTLKAEPVDATKLRLTFYNWSNPLGTTLKSPLEIGTFGGRSLMLMFVARRLGEKREIIEVTVSFLLGAEATDG